ncbi:MAG TPA: alpha/beta hydrolase [Nitriliruptorales bacterium]|nr:alpha/beta hydrolase [Nitriliruptorales bacterium]
MSTASFEDLHLRYAREQVLTTPDGIQLYYEQYGAGPQLTIVNNYFLISPLWRNFTRELALSTSVLTYDLRNQGCSSPADGPLSFGQHVDDLIRLLDGLEVEQTYLLGTSISTLICRDLAATHPDRVRGLILVGPVFNPYGARRRKYLTRSWLKTLESSGPAGLFAHIYPLVFGDRTVENGESAAFLALRERFLALNSYEQLRTNLAASLTTGDDPALLRKITCPTLLLAGDGDFLCSGSSLRSIASLMPRARVELVAFAGHVPYFENTDVFERSVLRFIESVESS